MPNTKNSQLPSSVYFNNGSWEAFNSYLSATDLSKIFVLTDANTLTHCLPVFKRNCNITDLEVLTMQAGESHKTISSCLTIWQQLSDLGADRNSLLINLGGGVITDLGGFVAATFKRGIRCINIPTSLLAMVDASVGGKNGVDLGGLKNQIGVIKEVERVFILTEFLKTLPREHLISGMAEMLKHGLIHSDEYWKKVARMELGNTEERDQLILESVKIKYEIVSKDPLEKDVRKTLNYGHTLGHAIESYCLEHENKTTLLHGEAVAIGLILANYISSEILSFPKAKRDEISTVILRHFPKQEFNHADITEIIKLLVYDKKNTNGKVRFVLLKDIGAHSTNCEVPNDLIHNAFSYYENF
jgi:3-dehydroquinate synthase